ncbi:MAG: aldehyde dehydrogenase family protein [Cyclobacteriaceae bacterium]
MQTPSPEATDKAIENEIDSAFGRLQAKSTDLRYENYRDRKGRLKILHNWVVDNRNDICQAIYSDFRKPAEEVDLTEIYAVLQEIKHASGHLKKWMKPKKVSTPVTLAGSNGYIHYEPKGICLIIAPWNYPFSLTIGPLISALAAGNTVILKPSEMTPATSALIVRLVRECFSEDIVRIFTGDKEVSTLLLQKPFNHIFFTGSPAVGKIVMTAAAKHLASVTLELGGKSPLIVDDMADLKDVAEKLAWGKYVNTGQTCIAPDYVLCHEQVKSALLVELRSAIERLFKEPGKDISESSTYARIINQKHFDRLESMLSESVSNGATVVSGGHTDKEKLYFAPTVLTDIPESSPLLDQEIFGPILPVLTYSRTEEAISFVNSKPKPLAMYLFCGSRKNRKTILRQTSAGGVCINDTLIHFNHPNLPFGGVNNSGIGKSHGHYGFLAFSNEKSILVQRVGYTSIRLIYPPYTPRIRRLIDLLLKYL